MRGWYHGKNPQLWVFRILTLTFLAYVRLGQLRVKDCPAWARNRRKVSYEKITATRDSTNDL